MTKSKQTADTALRAMRMHSLVCRCAACVAEIESMAIADDEPTIVARSWDDLVAAVDAADAAAFNCNVRIGVQS